MVVPPGFEPGIPPWKGDVLTTWPWDHWYRHILHCARMVILYQRVLAQGLIYRCFLAATTCFSQCIKLSFQNNFSIHFYTQMSIIISICSCYPITNIAIWHGFVQAFLLDYGSGSEELNLSFCELWARHGTVPLNRHRIDHYYSFVLRKRPEPVVAVGARLRSKLLGLQVKTLLGDVASNAASTGQKNYIT